MSALPAMSIVVCASGCQRDLRRQLQSIAQQRYPNLQVVLVGPPEAMQAENMGAANDVRIEVSPSTPLVRRINQGLARAEGDVVTWLSGGEIILPGMLHSAGAHFQRREATDVFAGCCEFVDLDGDRAPRFFQSSAARLDLLPAFCAIARPGCFFRRRLLSRKPVLDETLPHSFELEFWCHLRSLGARWDASNLVVCVVDQAVNREAVAAEVFAEEQDRIYRRYCDERIPLSFWHRRLRYPLENMSRRADSRIFDLLIYRPLRALTTIGLSPFYGFDRVRLMQWRLPAGEGA